MAKILFVGDAVVPTGFAACTHTACDALHNAGHDVSILGINTHCDMMIKSPYPYDIYSCLHPRQGGTDPHGVGRFSRLVYQLNPDIVIILQDTWNVPAYIYHLRQFVDGLSDNVDQSYTEPYIMVWAAVDSMNQHVEGLNEYVDHMMVWTRFARQEVEAGGWKGFADIVPLGVDTGLFTPQGKEYSRSKIFGSVFSPDDFIVGMVGRNQPRKNVIGAMESFAKFVNYPYRELVNKPYLYLHTAPTGEKAYDVLRLAKHFGIEDHVKVADQRSGHGLDNSLMPMVYSAMDVLINTSWAEGWSLPTLEAMACCVPVIVPDHSSFGDDGWLPRDAPGVYKVRCSDSVMVAPLDSVRGCWTVGRMVDTAHCAKLLGDIYQASIDGFGYSKDDIRSAISHMTWDRVGQMIVDQVDRADYLTKAKQVGQVA